MSSNLSTYPETASALQVSVRTLKRLVKIKRIKPVRIGRLVRFHLPSVMKQMGVAASLIFFVSISKEFPYVASRDSLDLNRNFTCADNGANPHGIRIPSIHSKTA